MKKLLALEELDREVRIRILRLKRRLLRLRRRQQQEQGSGKWGSGIKRWGSWVGIRGGVSESPPNPLNDTIEQTLAELRIASEPGWKPPCGGQMDRDDDDDEDWMDDLYDEESNECDSSIPPQRPRRRVKAMTRESDALDDMTRCFHNIVYSSLPYTVCSSEEKYKFKGVLLDEERILGLEVRAYFSSVYVPWLMGIKDELCSTDNEGKHSSFRVRRDDVGVVRAVA